MLAAVAAFVSTVHTAPQYVKRAEHDGCDPFAILDEQNYVLPDNVRRTFNDSIGWETLTTTTR